MMHGDAAQIYEGWRRHWLSGGDSNAIAVLRFHGLRGALAMAGAAGNRTRPRRPSPPSVNVDLAIGDAVIVEAASQVRRLLRVSLPAAAAVVTRKYEESRHV